MAQAVPPSTESQLIDRVLRPFQQFARSASSGGIVLLVCTAAALAWANSPWAESYGHLWERKVTLGTPGFGLTMSLHHWINDGLMAVFFFVVRPLDAMMARRRAPVEEGMPDEERRHQELLAALEGLRR